MPGAARTIRISRDTCLTERQLAVLCLLQVWPRTWARAELLGMAERIGGPAMRMLLQGLRRRTPPLVEERPGRVGHWRITDAGSQAAFEGERVQRGLAMSVGHREKRTASAAAWRR